MKKPRIVWLHSHFLLNTGGTRYIFAVAQELKKRGWNIVFVVEQASEDWKFQAHHLGIEIAEISPITSTSLVYWLFFPLFFLRAWWRVRSFVQPGDVVVASMFPFQVIGSLITKRSLFLCFEPFAFFYDPTVKRSFSFFKQGLLEILAILVAPLDRWGTRRTSVLIGLNTSVARYIKAVYGRSVDAVTGLGVELERFHSEIRPLFPRDTGRIRVLHSTDYTPLKGTWFVLKAWKWVHRIVPSAQLLISESVPNPQEKTRMLVWLKAHHLASSVEFVGHIPWTDFPAFYASGDVYAFAGDPGSWGATAASLSVLEAASCGLPVVRSPGNSDEVLHELTGLIADPRKEKVYALALIRLLKSRDFRKQLGNQASARVQQRNAWGKVASRLESQIVRRFGE